MRDVRIIALVVAVSLLVAGVVGVMMTRPHDESAPLADGPRESISRDGAMSVQRASVPAGKPLLVRFRGNDLRGVAYELTPAIGAADRSEYVLFSDKNPDGPGVHRKGDGVVVVVALGVSGPGPDTLPTPADARPGNYRLCVHSPRHQPCVSIRLT